jgi:hypothetical protein
MEANFNEAEQNPVTERGGRGDVNRIENRDFTNVNQNQIISRYYLFDLKLNQRL